jgi:general nucleoside transport system ATP-binding protein
MIEEQFAIEMHGITKVFGETVKANDEIDLTVEIQTIHALVGENGAGKSTLMKILYGMHQPDQGRIFINGKEQRITSPLSAIQLGIGMVHQHFMLVGTLSVLENIILGDESVKAGGILDLNSSTEKIKRLLKSFGININLNAKVGELPVGTQQKIEILKLLYRNAEILILDEPTAVLNPAEIEDLFGIMRILKSSGKTIILISHKLAEVLAISDSITVLRSGKAAGNRKTSLVDKNELASLIVGEEIPRIEKISSGRSEDTVLLVSDVTISGSKNINKVKKISFNISSGEIFGIAGVEGNGQSELVEAIAGLRKVSAGKINVNGRSNLSEPVSHIPADRHRHGMVKEYDIASNILLGRQREKDFRNCFFINRRNVTGFADQMIKEFDIRPADHLSLMGSLSGGNQQKAVAARELSKDSRLIIAEHPTRGLDIKAANFVHRKLLAEKAKGKAILLVSSDLNELLEICDRIAVMYNGEITVTLEANKTSEKEIGMYMTGSDQILI